MTYSAELDETDLEYLGRDNFVTKAWLKYADKVADKEDVLDFIIEKKIGVIYASTYSTVASYAEKAQKDLKKAEKTLRLGMTYLGARKELEAERRRLEFEYESFERRIA